MGKPELALQYLDEWMLRWRKFQTESDWRIEKDRQWWRQFNIAFSFLEFCALVQYSSGVATVRRQWGLPHFFDVGLDAKIKDTVHNFLVNRWRYTPQGYGRVMLVGIPTYLTFFTLEHIQESRRLSQYIEQPTIFGEQARRLVNTGKIEEYLAVHIANGSANAPEQA